MFTFSMTFVSNWFFNFSLFEQLWLKLFFNRFIFLRLLATMYLFSVWKLLLWKLTALLIGGDAEKNRQFGDIKATANTYTRCFFLGGGWIPLLTKYFFPCNTHCPFHIKAIFSAILSWRNATGWNVILHIFVWKKWKSGETTFLA